MHQSSDILVVDDDENIITLIVDTLSDEGYNVRVARNGRVAIEEVMKNAPCLILLDVMMPIMSGPEALQELQRSGFGHIPVIMMSAGVQLAPFVSQGAIATLAKPFQLDQLIEYVQQHAGAAPEPKQLEYNQQPAQRETHNS